MCKAGLLGQVSIQRDLCRVLKKSYRSCVLGAGRSLMKCQALSPLPAQAMPGTQGAMSEPRLSRSFIMKTLPHRWVVSKPLFSLL